MIVTFAIVYTRRLGHRQTLAITWRLQDFPTNIGLSQQQLQNYRINSNSNFLLISSVVFRSFWDVVIYIRQVTNFSHGVYYLFFIWRKCINCCNL